MIWHKISIKINLQDLGLFPLKRDIQRYVFSTETFFRKISGPRYLKTKTEVLVIVFFLCILYIVKLHFSVKLESQAQKSASMR